MTIKRVLMCPPTYFDIEYSINPYMDVTNKVDKAKAHAQWEYVYQVLENLGISIDILEPVEGLPDMTFIGDAGIVYGDRFLSSNFRFEERQGEVRYYEEWMASNGYKVFSAPEHIYFEGLGDIVYYNSDVLFGYGQRSSQDAIEHVLNVVPEFNVKGELELKDSDFYHLGLAISLIDQDTVMYYPGAFTEPSVDWLRRNYPRVIECDARDAKEYFVCNNIPIGNKILMDNCSEELEEQLQENGFQVIRTDMSEFKKSGGSVRCLILCLE